MVEHHRTMRGRTINMMELRDRHGDMMAVTPAEGARMNARGDLIGAGGKIIKTREEITQEYYEMNGPSPGREDRLSNINFAGPQNQNGDNLFRRPSPQTFDNIDFKTPEQILAEAQAQQAKAQQQQAGVAQAGNPEPIRQSPQPMGRRNKLVQKDDGELDAH